MNSNEIGALVKKHLKNNDDAVFSANHLTWVKELIGEIGNHFCLGDFGISKGTIDSPYGYNLHVHSSANRSSLYFRINPNGVEFNNNKVVYKECSEELVKSVVDYCNEWFLRSDNQ